MKKRILCVMIFISVIVLICGCNFPVKNPTKKYVSYENSIGTKRLNIDEAKRLFQVNELYYFDCDFSKLEEIEIIDISYNISVSGNLILDKNTEKYIFDLNNWGEINLVSNYAITDYENCFGFSFITTFFRSKIDVTHNDGTKSTLPLILFNKTTFTSINKLSYSSTTYGYDNIHLVGDISVPTNFYKHNIQTGKSNECIFYQQISDDRLRPFKIFTHYENSIKRPSCNNDTTLDKLTEYIYSNAIYIKS